MASKGFFGWFTLWFDTSVLCTDFTREWGLANALPLVAPLAIVVMNAILKLVFVRT